ncbi:MAG TPA: hypothetical protein PKM41_00400 [Deltaproteobacteria bacterium]|jgi:hypothetical protein|nr:hypothetical protein [Deltaproteobacteria bacterium]HOI05996.1 hypothetical protein [Deltaproteobacteria bacterium]
MRTALIALLAMLALLPVPGAAAQEGTLRISAQPESVPVGGTFRLVLAYTLPAGARVHHPPEIRGVEGLIVVKQEAAEGRITLTVLADSLDPVRIGPLELGYAGADGKKAFLRSGVLTISVASNLKGREEAEPKPIMGIVPTGRPWLWWLAAAGLALLGCAVLAGIAYVWKRRTNRGGAAEPPEPPHVRAEREIEALLKENLFEQGLQKEFYFRFTEIVKRYLGAVRGFPAPECTTEEIAGRIAEHDRPVLSILRFADRVKFADEAVPAGRKDDDVSAFLAYVDVTAPKAAPAGEDNP